MSRLYTDVHVPAAVTAALRVRGVDVVTAQEDGRGLAGDAEVLDRATGLGRVLVTMDEDFLAEATRRQRLGIRFGGVIYTHQLEVTLGRFIDDLELICAAGGEAYMLDRVEWIPLR